MAFLGGSVEIPVGLNGLNGSQNEVDVPPGHLLVADNIRMAEGMVQKAKGAVKYTGSPISGTPSIIGGMDWHPTSTSQRVVVVTSAGDVLRDNGDGSFSVTLKSGLTVDDVNPVFVSAGQEAAARDKKLFLFTEKNEVQVLSGDGSTMSNINATTKPVDWTGTNQPIFGVQHIGRLWAGGNANDPHRIYYSTLNDHEDFTSAGSGSLAIYPGEGGGIIGAVSFKGVLIIWKTPSSTSTGTYVIDTRDPTVANWRIDRLSSSIGGASPNGYTVIDDDVVFMGHSGHIHLLSGVQEFGNIGSRNLSDLAFLSPYIRNNFNPSRFKFAKAIYHVRDRELTFTYASTGNTVQDRQLKIDLNATSPSGGLFPRFHVSPRDVVESIWLYQDSDTTIVPMAGDNAGVVWKMGQDTKSKDGVGYEMKFQTPHDDLDRRGEGFGARRKNGKFLEVTMQTKGNHQLDVDVLWDGVKSETVNFNLGSTASTLGSFVLGTDKLGKESIATDRKRIRGSGRRVSLVGRNNVAGGDAPVSKFTLSFTLGDERTTRTSTQQ